MGALAPVSTWTPEDDVLLRNSVEAGASLESLAKGAVQFSRKFTVRELQDRWHSLLYDPVVSAEAAFHMIEFERSVSFLPSKFNRTGNSKEKKGVSEKRKAESVRSCYSALRKRIRNEPFNSMDLNFLVAPNNSNCIGNGDEPLLENCILGDPLSGHFGLQESNFDVMHCAFPAEEEFPMQQDNNHNIHKEIPHVLGENGSAELASAFDQTNGDLGNVCYEFERNQVFDLEIPECGAPFHDLDDVIRTDPKLKLHMPCDEMKSPPVCTENYLTELSNSLLDLTNDDLFMDVDGKDLIDKTYYDGLSSLLFSSPNDVNQDHMVNITEPETSVTPEYRTNPTGACPGEFDNNGKSQYKDGHEVCNSEVQMLSSTPASNPKFPELSGGVICCTLNTEDPEIPCNDDVFMPNRPPPSSVSSVPRRSIKDADHSNSTSVKDFSGNRKMIEGGLFLMQSDRENPSQPHASSQMIRSQAIPEISQLHPIGDCGVKFELPNSDSRHVGSKTEGFASGVDSTNLGTNTLLPAKLKEETKVIALVKQLSHNSTDSFKEKPDSYRSYPQTNASGGKQERDVLSTIQDHQPLNAKVGSTDIAASELIANPPAPELEELPVESDDDLPYFSDIEAMILDMDLDPDDQDLYEQEVSRYLKEDTMRAIIRLEQGAHSYMQRDIGSHGAFAILYGHHSKHYIKKPEVLLGRVTEDMTVDIDLGREGHANKISRRQAIINMDEGGSFHLKNLGKCLISVNNKEVAPGQSLSLKSSCLIEIRGMPFVFETNQTCVKRYLDSIAKKNQTHEHQL